jgi:hypothetical protein
MHEYSMNKEMKSEMRKWGGLTNEESAGKGPLLGATDDGERQPMGGNEGMQKRNGGNSSDCGQIFGAETSHHPHAKRRSVFSSTILWFLQTTLPNTTFLRSISNWRPPTSITLILLSSSLFNASPKTILFFFFSFFLFFF